MFVCVCVERWCHVPWQNFVFHTDAIKTNDTMNKINRPFD